MAYGACCTQVEQFRAEAQAASVALQQAMERNNARLQADQAQMVGCLLGVPI